MNQSEIFKAAIKLATQERNQYLDQACGHDPQKRAELESLLRAHDTAESFLERPAKGVARDADLTADYQPISEGPGSVIGPYRLMEQVGEGGFGLVFVAQQTEPVRRKVALKIIKPGMDTKEVIARFEAERQALALMDHPNIAKVLDAGTTASGRPYFVMELIRGIPIVEYCDDQKLSMRERLKLFVAVCRAVQHAHAKGVIHRDLKPSNILVSPHDGVPVPKIIDFGIAKAIGQQLTDKTIYTRLTQMIGTPLYMSPEQAEINALDVDTRSDVYSLGVLLYELLTGTTPFDSQRFSQAAYEEIKRIIREEDPPTPSRRLKTLGETLTSVSKQRSTEPARLTASVQGELDWIVMCCLEKERSRRYQTAAGLAEDIQRYLDDKPVQAVPPGQLYKTKKLIHRNRIPIAVAVGYVVLSVIGMAATLIQARKANDASDTALRYAAEATTREEETRSTNTKLESVLAKLKDTLVEKALAAAFGGNRSEFQDAIEDLRQVPGSDHDIIRLDALLGVFSGDSRSVEGAVRKLKSLVAEDPKDVVAWGILQLASYNFAIGLDDESRATQALKVLNAKTTLEKLIVGYGLGTIEGAESLNKVVRDNPGWSIARAMLAGALSNSPLLHEQPQRLSTARTHIEAATILRPGNPFVLATKLQVVTAEYLLATATTAKSPAAASLLVEGQEVIKQLQSDHDGYIFGQRTIGEFYTACEENSLAIDIWEKLIRDHKSQSAQFFYHPLSYLENHRIVTDDESIFPIYYLLVDDPRKALEVLNVPNVQQSNMNRVWAPFVYQLCGRDDNVAKAICDSQSLIDDNAWWISNTAKLWSGKITPEQMLNEAENDRYQLTHHLLLLAFYYLTQPHGRANAIEYNNRAIALNCRTMDTYSWCKALKAKLDREPEWPASLKSKLESPPAL